MNKNTYRIILLTVTAGCVLLGTSRNLGFAHHDSGKDPMSGHSVIKDLDEFEEHFDLDDDENDFEERFDFDDDRDAFKKRFDRDDDRDDFERHFDRDNERIE